MRVLHKLPRFIDIQFLTIAIVFELIQSFLQRRHYTLLDTHSCQVHSLKKNKSSFIIKYFFATTRNDVTKRPFWTHFRKPWKSVFNSSKIPINIFTSLILKIYPFLHVYYTKFTKIIHFSNNPHVILIFISYLDCPHNIYE